MAFTTLQEFQDLLDADAMQARVELIELEKSMRANPPDPTTQAAHDAWTLVVEASRKLTEKDNENLPEAP